MLVRIAAWDVGVSRWMQARRNRLINLIAQALSWSGAGGVWAALSVALAAAERLKFEVLPDQRRFLGAIVFRR